MNTYYDLYMFKSQDTFIKVGTYKTLAECNEVATEAKECATYDIYFVPVKQFSET